MNALVVLAFLALSCSAGFVPLPWQDDQVCFNNKAEGLPWPVTPGRDPGQLIPHGHHCLEMARMFAANPPTNRMDSMHQQHCLVLLNQVYDFLLATSADYRTPPFFCNDVKKVYHGEATSDEYYLYLTYQLVDERLEYMTEGAYYALANLSKSQNEFVGLLNGQNLGYLLLREANGRNMSEAERRYLAYWHDDVQVRFAALGLFCLEEPSPVLLTLCSFLGRSNCSALLAPTGDKCIDNNVLYKAANKFSVEMVNTNKQKVQVALSYGIHVSPNFPCEPPCNVSKVNLTRTIDAGEAVVFHRNDDGVLTTCGDRTCPMASPYYFWQCDSVTFV